MTDVDQPLPMMQAAPPDAASGGEARFRQRISTAVGIAAIIAVLIFLLALTFRPLLLIFMSILFALGLRGL